MTFEKNIESLDGVLLPDYINQIKEAKYPKWAEPINSQDQTPNLLITKGNRKTTAYQMIGWKADIKERTSNIEFKDSTATLVIGCSLGFFLKEAIEKADEKHKLICVEPDAGMLKYAFENADLSEAIKSKQLIICPTDEDAIFALEYINERNTIDDWQIVIEGYTIDHPLYQDISYNATNALNQIRCNIGTVSNAGAQIADNDIANLPYIIHRRGIAELENLYKGKPAIIVSTGPSLKKNIFKLMGKANKAVIIAVGQALRPLLAYDIKPDFICSVDFGKVNLSHYEGLMDSDVPLIALNRSFAPLLKRWKGPMFVSTSPFVLNNPDKENRIHNVLAKKGWTIQGGSVAHMCYGVALHMGCSPIIMMGQDLAYDSEQSHFPQADSRGVLEKDKDGFLNWKVTDPRSHLNDNSYSMGAPIQVQGYYFKPVYTNAGLASFITAFERFIKLNPDTPVINATEGGAHIQGTTRMSLDRAMEKYCSDKINKTKAKPLLSNADDAWELIDESIPLLEKEIELLKKLMINSKRGMETADKISKIKNNSEKQKEKLISLLYKNDKCSKEAQSIVAKLPLVQLAIYGASRQIQHSKLNVDGSRDNFLSNEDDAKIRIKRNKIILKAALDTAKKLKETYTASLNSLRRASKSRDLSELISDIEPEPEPSIKDAEDYFKAGNFARPMLEAKRLVNNGIRSPEILEVWNRCLEMRLAHINDETLKQNNSELNPDNYIDHVQLVDDAQKEGRENKDFDKALEMLDDAYNLCESELALWGLATANFHAKNYDKSIELYEKLISKYPKNRYKFEFGQVYIYSGDIKNGLIYILDAMQDTDEFDSFLPILGDIFHGQELYSEAIEQYKKCIEKMPFDYSVYEKMLLSAKAIEDNDLEAYCLERIEQIKGR